MDIPKTIKKHHDKIISVAKGRGAVTVRLFGSAAQGTTGRNSDIDLLVEMKPGSNLLDIIAIKQDLEDLLGVEVDVVTEGGLSPYIREDILKKAVNL